MTQKNVKYVYVIDAYADNIKANELGPGKIGLYGDNTTSGGTDTNISFDSTNALPGDYYGKVRFGMGTKEGGVLFSPWFRIPGQRQDTIAETAYTGTLDFTGITGSDAGKVITPKLVIHSGQTMYGNKSIMKEVAYRIKTGDTGTEVAEAIAYLFNKVMEKEPEQYVTITENGAGIVTFTGHNNVTTGAYKTGMVGYTNYNFELLAGSEPDLITVTNTGAVGGFGIGAKVRDEEWFANGNYGYGDRVDSVPVDSIGLFADVSLTYSALNFNIMSAQFTNVVGQTPGSLVQIDIYAPDANKAELDKITKLLFNTP